MAPIASRVAELNGEGALSVFARAKELEKLGRSIIHLELGEPDFHPAAPVVNALRAAVVAGRDRYVSPRGILALREAGRRVFASYTQRARCTRASPNRARLQNGALARHDGAHRARRRSSLSRSGFPIYPSFARGLGAKAVPFFWKRKNQFSARPARNCRENFAAHQSPHFQFPE